MELQTLRKEKKLSQKEAAALLDISLRTYIRYEKDGPAQGAGRYQKYCLFLQNYEPITETRGLLSLEDIHRITGDILKHHGVTFAILFGSYAKGKAREDSDVDILILTKETGLAFFGLTEELRQALHKKVDLLDAKHIAEDPKMVLEILKTGVRIYG